MKAIVKITAVIVLSALFGYAQHADHNAPASHAAQPIALISTDAITRLKVATKKREAQEFFDQGLTLYYAFNDGDAVRSFRRAADLDPQLAMAYWGVALASYPRWTGGGNAGDQNRAKAASDAIKMALSMPSPKPDRVYIEALAKLFSDDIAGSDRSSLDNA